MAYPAFETNPSESRYVAVTPCRIIDTRNGAGVNNTPFSALQTRTFSVGGTTGFTAQGGKSGGCGIPVGAVGVAATLTAAEPNPDSSNGGFHACPTASANRAPRC